MPDTGAPWNIPYADPTDLVRDWPDLSEDVADAVALGLSAAGGLVEVKTVVKTDTQASSVLSGESEAVSGLTIAHSVADAAHRVLLFAYISGQQTGRNMFAVALTAGGTALNLGAAAGNRTQIAAQNASDSATRLNSVTLIATHTPGSTGSVTYGVNVINADTATNTVHVNRSNTDTDTEQFARASSFLLLAEVKV